MGLVSPISLGAPEGDSFAHREVLDTELSGMLMANLSLVSIHIHSSPSNTHIHTHAHTYTHGTEHTSRTHPFISFSNKHFPGSMKGRAVV